ncbi:biotin--[acetyl-CoA-carboxylase] ligase [Desertivirga brevis]|uniref:biotin--[acetyl-CoA-carboxylase] ligase n=1 Tax=Desertivirga brevis TaxID=2810310 RepID=UPI001A96E211|nr:biotin--[acetyl-CoA-carboxylase] ligase [Pedobacter sp. SYSU D00873]
MQINTFSRLIVGQKIVVLERIDSTNDYLKRELAKSTPFPEGTVIMAEEQFAGRGQSQNKWLSLPGLNLTFSILLFPTSISPENQFELNIAISLATNDVLLPIIGEEVKIKWPNDIYYRNQKIGGILIENSLQGKRMKNSIVGIGLNVNQTEFDPLLTNVSSLKQITGQNYELKLLLLDFCKAVESRYLDLNKHNDRHREEYLQRLFRFGEPHFFEIGGQPVLGVIREVDEAGRLVLDIGGERRKFSSKELSFII